jgi:uncharacterized protein DUF1194
MGRIRRALFAFALAYGAVAMLPAPAAWSKDVDLALILAIDVSGSVNAERWELQRRGYEAAFNSPEVLQSITSGPHKAIAVTMVEWSGQSHQRQVVEWTVVEDELSAATFASLMAEAPRVYSDWTSISAALDFAVPLFRNSGVTPSRNVIDVSGDGVNNQGRQINDARDDALAKSIVINGLPILSEYDGLDGYYQDHVIGGAGAFMEVVKDYSTFSKAVLSKLVREIVDNDDRARAILAKRLSAEPIQAAETAPSGLKQTTPESIEIAIGLRALPAQGPARQ